MPRDVVLILPSIRSTYNTGSFFRTADAFGVSKIYLCGFTAIPPHPHLVKVSLGAEKSVSWEYVAEVSDVIKRLRGEGYQLVGVEQSSRSVPLERMVWEEKVAIVMGHEVSGMDTDLMLNMHVLVEIPMRGKKESLNVAVAGGIVLYAATYL